MRQKTKWCRTRSEGNKRSSVKERTRNMILGLKWGRGTEWEGQRQDLLGQLVGKQKREWLARKWTWWTIGDSEETTAGLDGDKEGPGSEWQA